jgi:hypothetical protein
MEFYREIIMSATGCSREEAMKIEDIMRDVIFHSTLDWLTREEFEEGARLAQAVLREMRRVGRSSSNASDRSH